MVTDRTLTLYHVTPERNWFSILQIGLKKDSSMGRLKAVWLVSKTNLAWACTHVSARHSVSPGALVVFEVRVRRRHLKRSKVRGAWYCVNDVHPSKFMSNGVLEDYQ